MRHFTRTLFAVACAGAFVATAQAQTNLKMQASWPASLTLFDNFKDFSERVNKMTGGQLKIEAMPAGQVVPAFEVLDASHKKVIDGAHTWAGYWMGKNKAGKPAYFLSQKTSSEKGQILDEEPKGYEIYEKPDGQVFCRKTTPQVISDDEIAVVEKELARRQLKQCAVERKGKDLIVSEGQGLDLRGALGGLFMANPKAFEAISTNYRHYQPVLRFQLIDKEKREFALSRWCFLGSIDGWHFLSSGKLGDLAKKYVKHIGKESFYELM